ncbi:hypothetical protein P153DRAFT_364136 [Dothidotthia symphoricarpi CBS 119687]|uniref:Transcription initiation factor IIF subunit beta n=1 Tax=Dothidotthia symphoricarpi CBS 119687 TaxID=1392245 RepID=A0A6A6AM59_9PLEO|nr:uncharacterized protein P153DRAFT_364136 [Dothidotthia symphoricarpi CBS 119687]KAF2132880.1 hypothetical protein P153DRAFT_364136 [Dothidotthia symphoricarpi CBS 119687]
MNGVKADPDVKMEGTTPSGSGYMDDEFYEDTGELALPQGEDKDVWLSRIPDWLYDAVSKWEDLSGGNDNDPIQIGEVLGFATTSGIDKARPMRVFFNDQWRAKANLPTAFQLDPAQATDTVLGNTYVFTEKDLPGFRPNGHGSFNRNGAQGNSGSGTQDPKARVQKRGRYRKAIPKQTALVGHATRQYNANPLDTKEYKDFSAKRIKQAIQGSHTRTNITDTLESTDYNKLQHMFDGFGRSSTKKKSQLNKAARVSREELTDMLHACFDEFQYWPMKALKKRTTQPEAFLKEVLGDIAQLIRSGPFASNWQRLPMFNTNRDISGQQQEAAPEGESDGEEEMEDVV